MLLELLQFSQLYSFILSLWGGFIILLLFVFKRYYLRTLAGKLMILITGTAGGWFMIVTELLR